MSVNQAVVDSVVKSGELPHAVFVSLLREHVLPRLAPISAAEQRQISAAFERERSKAKREKDLIGSIALDKREAYLVSLVKKLEQSVRRNWHDGYESRLFQPLRAVMFRSRLHRGNAPQCCSSSDEGVDHTATWYRSWIGGHLERNLHHCAQGRDSDEQLHQGHACDQLEVGPI